MNEQKLTGKKKAVFVLMMLGTVYLCLELLSLVVINRVSSRLDEPIRSRRSIYKEQTEYIRRLLEPGHREVIDFELGWKYRPGFVSETDVINRQGVRSKEEYSEVPAEGVLRIAAFGDSFTYCNEVSNYDAWSAQMERMNSGVEVLNYGVGGYGTDQAFLRYQQEGRSLDPNVVIIGFAPTDLRRTVNVYRRFYSSMEVPLFKPRFYLSDGGNLELQCSPIQAIADYKELIANPSLVRQYGRHDQWYEPLIYDNPFYDVSVTTRLFSSALVRLNNKLWDSDRTHIDGVFKRESEAFRLQMTIFREFVEMVRLDGKKSVIVIFPDRQSIAEAAEGGSKQYQPLVEDLEKAGLPYVDLYNAFAAHDISKDVAQWFMGGGHYSPEGNRIVAEYLSGIISHRATEGTE